MYKFNEKELSRGVAVSKVLSSKTRLKILNILLEKSGSDICVKEIAEAIGISHSATSHQLSKLQDMGIVTPARSGQTMCYTLTKSRFSKMLASVIRQLMK